MSANIEPARDGGLAFNISVGWQGLIASKLPQGWVYYLSTLCLAAYRHSISIASVAAASEVISALS
jgi:hypothetical protein